MEELNAYHASCCGGGRGHWPRRRVDHYGRTGDWFGDRKPGGGRKYGGKGSALPRQPLASPGPQFALVPALVEGSFPHLQEAGASAPASLCAIAQSSKQWASTAEDWVSFFPTLPPAVVIAERWDRSGSSAHPALSRGKPP